MKYIKIIKTAAVVKVPAAVFHLTGRRINIFIQLCKNIARFFDYFNVFAYNILQSVVICRTLLYNIKK